MLDHLAIARVPATLFVGQNFARGAATLKRADAQGVEVANHTWSLRDLAKLGPDQAKSEIDGTQEAIQAAIGKRPTLLRPPYGSHGPGTRQLGLPLILWDVDTLDWQNRNAPPRPSERWPRCVPARSFSCTTSRPRAWPPHPASSLS